MRIVSLCPSLTELVFELGCGGQLVGRSKFCIRPTGAVDGVEKVGGTKNPKVERIIALAPDLVLLNEEENRLEDAEALRRAGLRCHTSMPRTVLDSVAVIRSVGSAVDRLAAAEALAAAIEARRSAVRSAIAGRRPVSFAYLIWRRPYMTVNGDTYVSALLTEAGGRNVFARHRDRYPAITPDELRTAAPDLVLLSSEPFPFEAGHVAELNDAAGVGAARVKLVDGELLSWHGPRTADGLEYGAELLGSGGGG